MPRKGMRSICFNPRTMSFVIATPRSLLPTTPRRLALTESVTEQIIDAAETIIMKWNPETSAYASVTSMFYEDKREAMQFLKHVNDLQKAMHLLVSDDSTNSRLIRAQKLMQVAMKRLQKELYQILSMNRAYLDPESVSVRSSRTSRSSVSEFEEEVAQDDDVLNVVGNEITEVEEVSCMAMTDLRSIAECMISSGYAKECINIYKMIRKSIIDEGVYKLGVEKMTSSQFNKMAWESMEIRVSSWLEAFKVSIQTLFHGERILCDTVFAASDSIRESCFSEISRDGAMLLFAFPEFVAKSKKSNSAPEKIFRVLDMYSIIVQNWKEIESIFSSDSLSTVRSQAMSSLVKLSESALTLLSEFESTIQKDNSKNTPPGGGIHNLTLFAMNYLTLLADHSNILADIIADWPPPEKPHLPDSFFNSPGRDDAPAISVRFGWLILVLLCKLDGKSKHYKDVTTSYLFLTNNLQHVVSRVRTSNLQYILGEEWVNKHESKVKLFAANYEKLAWGEVFAALPEKPAETPLAAEEVKECFKKFNLRFEEAYKKQSFCVIPDAKLRDEIKGNIGRKIVSVYREFYEKHRLGVGSSRMMRLIVRYTPEDIGNYLSDLYFGAVESDSSVSSAITSTTSSSHGRSLWLRS